MANGSLVQAVMDESATRVRALVAAGADLEERDVDRQTPLLIAAKTDQFEIAEVLLDAGADPLATSEFGWTVGYAAETSRLLAGPDADARQRVLGKLRAKGFPFPAPHPRDVRAMAAAGRWPPARAG